MQSVSKSFDKTDLYFLAQAISEGEKKGHSVRCMHAVIGKFTNLHFGILNKSEILGLKGLKVCP